MNTPGALETFGMMDPTMDATAYNKVRQNEMRAGFHDKMETTISRHITDEPGGGTIAELHFDTSGTPDQELMYSRLLSFLNIEYTPDQPIDFSKLDTAHLNSSKDSGGIYVFVKPALALSASEKVYLKRLPEEVYEFLKRLGFENLKNRRHTVNKVPLNKC